MNSLFSFIENLRASEGQARRLPYFNGELRRLASQRLFGRKKAGLTLKWAVLAPCRFRLFTQLVASPAGLCTTCCGFRFTWTSGF